MPANLSPECKSAEAVFRRARNPDDWLPLLRATRHGPHHKGTEILQADIKSHIKELTEELAGPKKSGARTGVPTTVRPERATQMALVAPPNSGKSSLRSLPDRLLGKRRSTATGTTTRARR